jgi:hypothetical protein
MQSSQESQHQGGLSATVVAHHDPAFAGGDIPSIQPKDGGAVAAQFDVSAGKR